MRKVVLGLGLIATLSIFPVGSSHSQGAPSGCFAVSGTSCPFNVNDRASFTHYYSSVFDLPQYQSSLDGPSKEERIACAIDCHVYYEDSRAACLAAMPLAENDGSGTSQARLVCLNVALGTLRRRLRDNCEINH